MLFIQPWGSHGFLGRAPHLCYPERVCLPDTAQLMTRLMVPAISHEVLRTARPRAELSPGILSLTAHNNLLRLALPTAPFSR